LPTGGGGGCGRTPSAVQQSVLPLALTGGMSRRLSTTPSWIHLGRVALALISGRSLQGLRGPRIPTMDPACAHLTESEQVCARPPRPPSTQRGVAPCLDAHLVIAAPRVCCFDVATNPPEVWARANRIRVNTFAGMTTGVWIGLRADKFYHNRKAGERFDDTVVVDGETVLSRDQSPYSWYCADRPYLVPSAQEKSGQSILTMSWLAPGHVLPTFLERYPRYAYYRERAPEGWHRKSVV